MSSTVPLRVLIVVTCRQRRGAEVEAVSIAEALADRGVGVGVVALSDAPTGSASIPGVDVLGGHPLGLRTLWRLRRVARHSDVVLAYGSTTLPACAIALLGRRQPFVYRSIGDPGAWLRGRLHRWRTAVLLRRARRLVALWPEAADVLRRVADVPADRLAVIPNARSPITFRQPLPEDRTYARARIGARDDERVLVFVGSLTPEKRVHLAIDAVAILPGCRLWIAGDGPLRSELEYQAREVAGGLVSFLGSIDEVPLLYHAADALVLPSATEGLPGVLIEAALCGCPVVASDVGGIRWLLSSGVTGEVVSDPVSADALAAAVDRTMRSDRAAEGRPTPWRLDVVAEAWQALLLDVAAGTGWRAAPIGTVVRRG